MKRNPALDPRCPAGTEIDANEAPIVARARGIGRSAVRSDLRGGRPARTLRVPPGDASDSIPLPRPAARG